MTTTKYDRLIITNHMSGFSKDGKWFSYSLIIERKPYGVNPAGDITFTAFKQGKTRDLDKFIENIITEKIINEYSGTKRVYHFEKPYRLRAQNSGNRTGYGWTWDWSGGYGDYTEGTYYGETTEYVFSGIYIR